MRAREIQNMSWLRKRIAADQRVSGRSRGRGPRTRAPPLTATRAFAFDARRRFIESGRECGEARRHVHSTTAGRHPSDPSRASRGTLGLGSTTNRRASHDEMEPPRHRAHPRAHPRVHRVARGRRRCHPRTVDAPPAAAAARTYRRDTIHDARLTDNAPRGTVDDTYECTGRGASGAG